MRDRRPRKEVEEVNRSQQGSGKGLNIIYILNVTSKLELKSECPVCVSNNHCL